MHLEGGKKKLRLYMSQMWPGIKNSLGIKIHQNCAVQSKVSWLSRRVNEKSRAKFCKSVFPKLFVLLHPSSSFMKAPASTEHFPMPLGSVLARRVASTTGTLQTCQRWSVWKVCHSPPEHLTCTSPANPTLPKFTGHDACTRTHNSHLLVFQLGC